MIHKTNNKNSGCFTLIELIVTVATITLISTVLIPHVKVAYNAKSNHEKTQCKIQLYKIYKAIESLDNNGSYMFPQYSTNELVTTNDNAGLSQVYSYPEGNKINGEIKKQVLFCPSASIYNYEYFKNNKNIHSAYIHRGIEDLCFDSEKRIDRVNLSSLNSNVSIITDFNSLQDNGNKNICHNGNYINVLYADGHVQGIKKHRDEIMHHKEKSWKTIWQTLDESGSSDIDLRTVRDSLNKSQN